MRLSSSSGNGDGLSLVNAAATQPMRAFRTFESSPARRHAALPKYVLRRSGWSCQRPPVSKHKQRCKT